MKLWFRLNFSPTLVVIVLFSAFSVVSIDLAHNSITFGDVTGCAFTALAAWICSVLCRANFYANRIDGSFEFYQARLKLRGIILEQTPDQDGAPCASEYRFSAPTVKIELGAIRSWRLLRAIYHQKVSLVELEKRSQWESTRVPTI